MSPTKTREKDSCSKPSTGTVKSGRWTNEEISQLVKMVNQGRTVEEIGDVLKRKPGSVTCQMSGLRVRSKLHKKTSMARLPMGPNPLALDIANLTPSSCRWPLESEFCKKRRCSIDSPYCEAHRKESLQTFTSPLNMHGIPT